MNKYYDSKNINAHKIMKFKLNPHNYEKNHVRQKRGKR